MNFHNISRCIEALKTATLTVAGIGNILETDCRPLSVAIMQNINSGISEMALKRFFGFVQSKSFPSLTTLNTLSRYCQYQNWEDFCNAVTSKMETEEASALHLIFDPLFTAVLAGPVPTLILDADKSSFTVFTYNDAFEAITFIENRNIRGLSFFEAFSPEKAGGNGPEILGQAFRKAVNSLKEVGLKSLHYDISSPFPGVRALNWWDVRIVPVAYAGRVKYLIFYPDNVTDKVLNQDAIEEAINKELTMAEDLATANVKLKSLVDSLAESHRELTSTKEQLEELNRTLEQLVFERTKTLTESEEKQRKLIDTSPVAIAVLKGPDHTIETANKKIIEYWGKTGDLINKPLIEALPEIFDQPFIEILNEVRRSGKPYVNPELCAYLNYNGVYQPRFFDMVYQPVQHYPSITDSIFIVAVDITEHVMVRKKLQQSESMLRLAVTAANVGIWSFDPETGVLTHNAIFAKIMGWESEQAMTFEQAIGQVTEEYRDKIKHIITNVIADGSTYEPYYEIKRFNDQQVIAIKAAGSTSLDDSGRKTIFSGVIREVDKRTTTIAESVLANQALI